MNQNVHGRKRLFYSLRDYEETCLEELTKTKKDLSEEGRKASGPSTEHGASRSRSDVGWPVTKLVNKTEIFNSDI